MQTGSVEGINRHAYYFETISWINAFTVSKHLNLPLSVYAENIIIASQNALVISLLWKYNKKILFTEKAVIGGGLLSYATVLWQDSIVHDNVWLMN